MITDARELATQRELTRAFIDADFETLTLTPRVSGKTSTGGRGFTNQAPRLPQKFKIIENVSRAMTNTRVPGGEQHEEEFTLLGYWDAVIGVYDIFTLRGATWEVISIEWDNGYEQRAQVRRFGR